MLVGPGEASDSSDTIVAINLTRPAAGGVLSGGPCSRNAPLLLAEFGGAQTFDESSASAQTFDFAPAGDALPLSFVDEGQEQEQESSLFLLDEEVRAIYTRNRAAYLRGFGGEPLTPRVVRSLRVEGVAVWSSEQLLSEVSRGRWGVCDGRASDLPWPAHASGGAVAMAGAGGAGAGGGAVAAAAAGLPIRCEVCAAPCALSERSDGGYAVGWACSSCQQHHAPGTERWHCDSAGCAQDFCFGCCARGGLPASDHRAAAGAAGSRVGAFAAGPLGPLPSQSVFLPRGRWLWQRCWADDSRRMLCAPGAERAPEGVTFEPPAYADPSSSGISRAVARWRARHAETEVGPGPEEEPKPEPEEEMETEPDEEPEDEPEDAPEPAEQVDATAGE